ncbi:MAG: hypothetical protein M3P93_06615 [Actinomycetota bacterium]|nr:hypothetical protein [Actinomycetota bacterium]
MRLLKNADVASVLTMAEGIAALRTGYADLARGDAAYVPRIDLYAPTGRDDGYYQWGSMAGTCRSYGVVAVRIESDVTTWPVGRTSEKYCVEPGAYSWIILLYSTSNGEPLALLQDGYLQHVRVGAAAGIGVDLMARPDADTLGSAREAVEGAGIVATATDAMSPTFDPTLVDVHRGEAQACTSEDELTLFVTTGTPGLRFADVGGRCVAARPGGGLGHPFPTEWFLQDIRDEETRWTSSTARTRRSSASWASAPWAARSAATWPGRASPSSSPTSTGPPCRPARRRA